MAQLPFTLDVLLVGMVLAALTAYAAWRHLLGIRRRALASALVGELAGVLRTIETSDLETRLRSAGSKPGTGKRPSQEQYMLLPEPVVFEANAGRLDMFEPSLARKIANLYALLKGVNGSLPSAVGDPKLSSAVLSELQEGLGLADDVLRQLRPLL